LLTNVQKLSLSGIPEEWNSGILEEWDGGMMKNSELVYWYIRSYV
jgi:hypothetical protein